MVKRLVEILTKKHIQNAMSNVRLEYDRIPFSDLLVIDDYIEGRISRNDFFDNLIGNVPIYNETPEEEAERLGLTGVAKELYADWQNSKITTDEYVREIIDDCNR